MADPDEPTRAWQPGDETNPGGSAAPDDAATRSWRPSDETPGEPRVFVPAPDPADATRVSPQVGPIAYEERAYGETYEDRAPRSNGPIIAVIVLLILILGVGAALLFTALNREDGSPDTTVPTTSSQPTSTTLPSTSLPSTAPTLAPPQTTLPTTAPTTTAPTTTALTTSTTTSSTSTPPTSPP